MRLEVEHDVDRQCFRIDVEGGEAYLVYAPSGETTLDFRSTLVPVEHRRRGVGEQLVLHALAYAQQHGYQVIPTCPFVKWVVARNPEWGDTLV